MRALAISFLFLTSAAVAAPTAAQLAKERVVVADKAYKGAVVRHKGGRTTVEIVYQWSVRLLAAELDAGKQPKQVLADHVTRMKDLEAEAIKARDAGAATPDEAEGATYFRLEAEYWQTRGKR
jgi:hypothetical protein